MTRTLSTAEKETIINYNYSSEYASIFTHEVRLITKLSKYCKEYPSSYKIIRDDLYAEWGCKTFSIPKKMVSIRQPKTGKPMSDEHKQKLLEGRKNFKNKNV